MWWASPRAPTEHGSESHSKCRYASGSPERIQEASTSASMFYTEQCSYQAGRGEGLRQSCFNFLNVRLRCFQSEEKLNSLGNWRCFISSKHCTQWVTKPQKGTCTPRKSKPQCWLGHGLAMQVSKTENISSTKWNFCSEREKTQDLRIASGSGTRATRRKYRGL